MFISTTSVWDEVADTFEQEYATAVVYGDFEQEVVLHEGAVRLLANGWVALPTDRLLSPEPVHHIDVRE